MREFSFFAAVLLLVLSGVELASDAYIASLISFVCGVGVLTILYWMEEL